MPCPESPIWFTDCLAFIRKPTPRVLCFTICWHWLLDRRDQLARIRPYAMTQVAGDDDGHAITMSSSYFRPSLLAIQPRRAITPRQHFLIASRPSIATTEPGFVGI